jgi:orotidine-5'-phosphate decarboxylase
MTAPIAVALDGMSEGAAIALARQLGDAVWGFKVNDLLLRAGTALIPRLRHYGHVFCDPKLHDIPHTVAHDVRALVTAGADLITVHCSGGHAMLQAALEAAEGHARIIGVTVLTSLDAGQVAAVYDASTEETVGRLARLALHAGLDGLVCSPQELPLLTQVDADGRLLRVTPGIRPADYALPDDQRRITTPAAALDGGSDLLVIGRPITGADDPVAACAALIASLSGHGHSRLTA